MEHVIVIKDGQVKHVKYQHVLIVVHIMVYVNQVNVNVNQDTDQMIVVNNIV